MLQILTRVAVACYAVNGALKPMQKHMDFFGALVIPLVTAIGGGTVRDLLLRRIVRVIDPVFLFAGACTAPKGPAKQCPQDRKGGTGRSVLERRTGLAGTLALLPVERDHESGGPGIA